MYLRLGQLPTIVVSSADTAEEVLKTKDLIFCTRPPLSKPRKMFYGGLNIAFTPYNEYLKQARRLCTSHLLNSSKVQLLKPIREEEIQTLMNTIRHQCSSYCNNYGLVNLSDMLLCLLNNITCRQVFGKRFEEDGECGRSRFHELVTEWTSLMGHFNIGEFFPSMEWINLLTGLHGKFKKCFKKIDDFLDEVIDAHIIEDGDDQGCFLSSLLRFHNDSSMEIPITRESIKAILMDLFIAGTDTGTLVLEWGMAELMKNPKVRRKAQNEIRTVVGSSKRKVEESELHQLKYLKQVVKEILRLHPPAAFLLPREAREECTINGHAVPCKTRVMVNVWAIGRDPEKWEDAEKFKPERFEKSLVHYKGQNFELLPFGAGRRGCPGVGLGSVVVELALANLLHGFDWEMPEGMKDEDVDMEESFGIVLRKKSALIVKAIPYV
ncbi:Premnaspirodiene oxygenase protein [Dioscorea alata]|uniref:Premnaspirodiene oxygenase protein n=1 Tax=Dioscorea alata TaxID=55571 RepID=A0ACB7WBN6_DIOAL|nr:Premnaspirodiene oxygenase protein [Dioscorea alata]